MKLAILVGDNWLMGKVWGAILLGGCITKLIERIFNQGYFNPKSKDLILRHSRFSKPLDAFSNL
jgi:hypothetical protein